MRVCPVTETDSPSVCLRQVLVLIVRSKVVLIEESATPQWSMSWNGVSRAILDI